MVKIVNIVNRLLKMKKSIVINIGSLLSNRNFQCSIEASAEPNLETIKVVI